MLVADISSLSLSSTLLKRNKRLQVHEVLHVLKEAQEKRSPDFVLRFAENTLTHHRYCLVISRKLLRSAVMRNRLRRQLYHLLSNFEHENKTPGSPSYDFIIYVRKSALDKSFKELHTSLSSLFLTP